MPSYDVAQYQTILAVDMSSQPRALIAATVHNLTAPIPDGPVEVADNPAGSMEVIGCDQPTGTIFLRYQGPLEQLALELPSEAATITVG